MSRVIEIPDWCRINELIEIKDVNKIRGDDPKAWYLERIKGYGDGGFFHQAYNCPVYFTPFNEWGKTVREYKRR